MNSLTEAVGYLAAFCTTLAFLPQALRVIQTKRTRDISRNMYVLMNFGIILWLTFGILKNELPIILANGITLILSLIILFYKLKEE